jgi:hypothetical protein
VTIFSKCILGNDEVLAMKAFLELLNRRRLRSYVEDPGLLKEHHGIEQTVLAGGYGYRQILELVQNGADAILEAQEQGLPTLRDNRIVVLLRKSRLYVANTGGPLSQEGLDALLRSHSSPKRGRQIGRFGLGFKSLLRLEGRIDLFTAASGAIRFDRRKQVQSHPRRNDQDAPGETYRKYFRSRIGSGPSAARRDDFSA